MTEDRPVSVADMLRARDERAARQRALLEQYRLPVISFTMNIAGSIKTDADIERAFQEGIERIERHLQRRRWTAAHFEQKTVFTGCEALWAVQTAADELKAAMCLLEEADALGRLFDIDVIDEQGVHLSRGNERSCIICGGPVRACARSRTHSAEELFAKTKQIIHEYFSLAFVRRVGETAQRALLYEALTTPKPGLVDCDNSGAHSDMDLFSFADSACALRNYFEDCVRLGMQDATFQQLQYAGILAEERMLEAVGVNTHKGAVFSLGILCYAMGSCGEDAAQEAVLKKAAEAGAYFLAQMKNAGQTRTGGERQYHQYGLTGARGEAASGFESVTAIALPALQSVLAEGKPLHEAGLAALLALMAQVYDSNIIRRAGMEGQQWVMAQAGQLLQNGWTTDDLRALDRQFIERQISPGGSADLLAVTYFLHFLGKGENEA